MKMSTLSLLALLLTGAAYAQPLFEKIETGPLVLPSTDSRSVNFVDVNNDGWEDLFITSGPQQGAFHLLYLNDGAGGYVKVTSGDIVTTLGPFDGATFADADNDGDLDLMAVTWHNAPNFLYFGNGDGSFDHAESAAPSVGGTYSETAAWGDYNGDGLVDLYVTNSNGNDPNFLYRNNGNGNFQKVSSGPQATDARTSRSVNWVDFDNDCDLDLFVSNESNQFDDLYRNLGNGSFERVSAGAPGQSPRSSMSSSWGDFDNDGDLDLFVANSGFYVQQNNQLFRNEGDGAFTEIAAGELSTDGGCSYGSNFGDFDNDGDLDLVVSNGYCNGDIVNFLYLNDGQGNFSRDQQSIADLDTPCSYGVAWGDMDNDGFLDLAFATCKNNSSAPLAKNLFYRNLGNANNWLKVKPVGTIANRSAIGAKVWVTASIDGQEVTQMREISAQSGYCGQNSLLAHFGLGNATEAIEVRIQFRCGVDTVLTNIAAGQSIEVVEPLSTAVEEPSGSQGFRLEVSPNPANGEVRIELAADTPLPDRSLRLHDLSGRLVWERRLPANGASTWSGSLSPAELGLPAGIFFLKFGEKVSRIVWY